MDIFVGFVLATVHSIKIITIESILVLYHTTYAPVQYLVNQAVFDL